MRYRGKEFFMFCQRCGNSVSPGKKFCGRCGSKIEIDPLASEEEISPLDPDKKSESLHAFSPLDSSGMGEKCSG